MTRPTGGGGSSVHIGKAAAIIVVALVLGVLVLKDDGGSGLSAAQRAALQQSTPTTVADTGNDDDTGDDGDTTVTTAAVRDPSQVKVVAINATSKSGVARTATTTLQGAGYNALQPGNATAAFKGTNPASVVLVVTSGYEREAAAVAALFGLPSSSVRAMPATSPSADIKGDVNVALIIGTGLNL